MNEIMQHPMNGTSVIAGKENHEVMCVSVCIIMSVCVCVCHNTFNVLWGGGGEEGGFNAVNEEGDGRGVFFEPLSSVSNRDLYQKENKRKSKHHQNEPGFPSLPPSPHTSIKVTFIEPLLDTGL